MTNLFYLQRTIKQPINGIYRAHLEALTEYLSRYHEDTGGLPSAAEYLEAIRHIVMTASIPRLGLSRFDREPLVRG